MRQWSWGWCLALWVGWMLTAPLCAGEKTDSAPNKDDKKESWFGRWFGSEEKTPDPDKIPPAEKMPRKKRWDANQPSVKDQELARAQEEAAFLRRLAVCDRLKEIAFETKDDALMKEAEELSQKAWSWYSQRSLQAATGTLTSRKDTQALDKQPGPTAARRAGKKEAASTVKSPKQRAAAKEE